MTFTNRIINSFQPLLLTCLFILAGIFLPIQQVSAQEDASLDDFVLDIKESNLVIWTLENNSQNLEESPSEEPDFQLKIWANGTYEEIEDGQQLSGLWTVDKKEDKLVLLCKSANGYDLQGENPPLKFEVESYTDKQLILIWRGPEVSIRKVYRRLPTPYRG